jgi:hypothetical protein
MAIVRAPNRDFTLNTAGNRVSMSAVIPQVQDVQLSTVVGTTFAIQPARTTLVTPGTDEQLINGYGYSQSG